LSPPAINDFVLASIKIALNSYFNGSGPEAYPTS
jgi:hypothetical protein